MADETDKATPKDVVLLHGPTDDGKGVTVLRARKGHVEVGEVRALAEGKPVTGDVVTLHPRETTPNVCDVEVHYEAPAAEAPKKGAKGPSQVATTQYRDNWEAIFGGHTSGREKALN